MSPRPCLAFAAALVLGLPACSVDVASLDLPPVAGDEAADPGGTDVSPVDAGDDPARDPGPGTDPGGTDGSTDSWTPDPGAEDATDPGPGLDPGTDTAVDPGVDTSLPDTGGPDTTCVPYCKGRTCVEDDGCGTPCGCAPGYECATDIPGCVFTDWGTTYRGSFRMFATVQMFPLPDQDVVCDGNLSVEVWPGQSPSVKGAGQCVTSAGTATVPVTVDLQGDIYQRNQVQGIATYGGDQGNVGQAPFAGTFTGPSPRGLSGDLSGGINYGSGVMNVYFKGGNFQVTEAL